jgi:hypothetical protein
MTYASQNRQQIVWHAAGCWQTCESKQRHISQIRPHCENFLLVTLSPVKLKLKHLMMWLVVGVRRVDMLLQ